MNIFSSYNNNCVYQIYNYNYVLLADVLHGMLLLSQLFRCADQPIKEGSWVLTWCATPPGGCLTSARGRSIQGAAPACRPRLATQSGPRWRGRAQ